MHNGSDDLDNNNGDDEASMDGSSTNPTDHGVASDQEPDQCNSDGVTSNSNENEGNELEEGDCDDIMDGEEPQNENNESLVDFFKLLPYMYLLQKNYESNGSVTPAFEFTSSQMDANSANLKNLLPTNSLQGLQNLRYLQQLFPNMLNGNDGFHSNANEEESEEDVEMDTNSNHEEPLDLTQKNKTITRVQDEKPFRPNQRSERGYTIQDLEAALHDIQSGKLGTRRAAVIYGIPRSTLRNKVYKLGKNNSVAKSAELYMGVNERLGDRDCELGFINGSTAKRSHSRDSDQTGEGTNGGDVEQSHKRFYNDNSPSLLRIDTLTANTPGGGLLDGHNNGERNQLLFTSRGGGGRGYNQRGSSPSLSLHNYPRAHGPGTSYDNYDESSLGKKSRPKRGKYRNYDREALARAVQAVQNGEMSVHRAGSFFGVPHSTLEYKVKERHLLRQAKFKGKSTTKPNINKMSEQAVTSLSSTATVDSNDSSHCQRTMPDLGKVSQYLNMKHSLLVNGERWRSSTDLLGLGIKDSKDPAGGGGVGFKKEINDALPKIYDSNETL